MIRLLSVNAIALVQDAGRPGRMHEGLPPGGALIPELLAAANRAAGNPPGAAAVELIGSLRLRAEAPARVAVDDEPARELATGETLSIAPTPRTRVRYLALAGGIDAPLCCGGRGAFPAAGIGRPLRSGDLLRPAAPPPPAPAAPPAPVDLDAAAPLLATAGPDLDRFPAGAVDALVAAPLELSPLGDRRGQRLLAGGSLRAALRPLDHDPGSRSAPMVRGAIQVTPAAELIVLGPDHPTTGGYPVLAVLHRAGLGRLAARRPGERVRVALAPAPAATSAPSSGTGGSPS